MENVCTHVVAGVLRVEVFEQGGWAACGHSPLTKKIVGDSVTFYAEMLCLISKFSFGRLQPRMSWVPVEDSILYRRGGHDIG